MRSINRKILNLILTLAILTLLGLGLIILAFSFEESGVTTSSSMVISIISLKLLLEGDWHTFYYTLSMSLIFFSVMLITLIRKLKFPTRINMFLIYIFGIFGLFFIVLSFVGATHQSLP